MMPGDFPTLIGVGHWQMWCLLEPAVRQYRRVVRTKARDIVLPSDDDIVGASRCHTSDSDVGRNIGRVEAFLTSRRVYTLVTCARIAKEDGIENLSCVLN